jgi:hypothetical protein
MTTGTAVTLSDRVWRAGRIAWTVATLVVVQIVVCGLAALPSVFISFNWVSIAGTDSILRLLIFSA